MKKIIILMLVACMFIGILSACGLKKTDKNGENTAQSSVNNSENSESTSGNDQNAGVSKDESGSASVNPGGIYKTSGSELTDFQDALLNSEKVFEEPLNSEDLNNSGSLDAQMAIAMSGMSIISLSMYDLLSPEDLPREEGKLILSGYDGVREKSGDEIKFSSNYTYPEDTAMNKAGDKYLETGTLNTRTNTLLIESSLERGGKKTTRTVYEAVILKDGTFIIQYLNAAVSSRDEASINTSAVFKRYNANEYVAIAGGFDGKMDFSYDSIAGKGDLQADAMAKNYKVIGKFTVKDGKASFSK